MRTNSNRSDFYFRMILLHIVFLLTVSLFAGCYTGKKRATDTVEMVVVFKIEVPIEKASSLLFEKEYIFHEGMDNSKGKEYLKKTGPKYIIQIPKEKITAFNLEMKKIPQIYEIYQADWTVNKN